jgi:hypothetical protein
MGRLIAVLGGVVFLLAGCGDVEEDSSTTSAQQITEGSIALQLTDPASGNSVSTVTTGNDVYATATVQDGNGDAVSGAKVDFTASLSSFSPTSGSVLTNSNGKATITLEAGSTTGADTIEATASVSGSSMVDSLNYEVTPSQSEITDQGSLEFVSADPETISLKGTGLTETSKVSFKLKDGSGQPVSGKTVDFTLTSTEGGLSLTQGSDDTNSDGIASTTVQAGTKATSVRVEGSVTTNSGGTLTTRSSKLVVSTGLPDDDSFSLSVDTHNQNAWGYDGVKATVTAHVADRFNNPVPDGTTIYFTTEGGSIESSCQTADGVCSVEWTSQDPRPTGQTTDGTDPNGTTLSFQGNPMDGRATVTASVVGEESFTDLDADGRYTDGDTFTDITETYQDYDEDGVRDSGFEPYSDFNGNETFDSPDGLYSGVLCEHSSNCASTETKKIFEHQVIIMGSESYFIEISDDGLGSNPASDDALTAPDTVNIGVWEGNGNVPAAGTTISVETTAGNLAGKTSYEVPDSIARGPYSFNVTLEDTTDSKTGTLTVTVTSPSNDVANGVEVVDSVSVTDP